MLCKRSRRSTRTDGSILALRCAGVAGRDMRSNMNERHHVKQAVRDLLEEKLIQPPTNRTQGCATAKIPYSRFDS